MRSNGLATILLMIPVLTVPALAVFGIPQFAPVVASPLDEGRDNDRESRVGNSARPAHDELFDDIDGFDSKERSPSERIPRKLNTPKSTPRHGRVTSADIKNDRLIRIATSELGNENVSQAGFVEDDVQSDLRRANSDKTRPKASELISPARREIGNEPLTWQTAVERLNEFEIRSFRLEPGNQPGQFLFICSYTPGGSSSVSYRFEAGADEPLKAVEKVLDQIVEWRQRQ